MPTSQTIDAFEVLGRTTVRAGDGSFLRLAGQGDDTPEPDPMLNARILAELETRRLSRTTPLDGRADLGIVASETLLRGVQSLTRDITLRLHHLGLGSLDDERALPKLIVHLSADVGDRSRLDHLPRAGTAVLRCYREGEILYIDPLRLDATDPPAHQVLRRRLAASPAATELEAWLSRQDIEDDPLGDLPPAAVALFLARLLTTITAWQHGTAVLETLRRTLWRLDTATLLASEHPVLAYPEPAPYPGRRR
ncbi:hypothetical protein [Arthrobacter sp. NPDC090010]|uniref:hypothetical protein n=1 Tax=Arthrobacter sp. NPDC090010 TaxID=3363942 RepID=UPI0037FA2168